MTAETHETGAHEGTSEWLWYVGVLVAAVLWWLVYDRLIPFSEWATVLFPVDRHSHTGEAIAFFLYDVPKVLLLLTGIGYVTSVLRSWFSPDNTRAILAGKREIWGYPLAALVGLMTPFCSSSSVPLFIGFVSAGIPLGVTFSFLIAGPIVGPVGLGLLYGLVGWEVATIYLVFGFTIAAVAGFVLGVGDQSSITEWPVAFEAVEAKGAAHVVPGHGHATTTERARADTHDYLMNLRAQIGALLDEGGDIMDAPKVDQSAFVCLQQFEALAGRNAQTAFQQMEWE